MLPKEVIHTDHELAGTVATAQEKLAHHRWHWTLDESNPARVSIRGYAREVGVSHQTIYKMVKGYQMWSVTESVDTLTDCIELAALSPERQEQVLEQAQEQGRTPAAVIKLPIRQADLEASETLHALNQRVPFDDVLDALALIGEGTMKLHKACQGKAFDEDETAMLKNRVQQAAMAILDAVGEYATI